MRLCVNLSCQNCTPGIWRHVCNGDGLYLCTCECLYGKRGVPSVSLGVQEAVDSVLSKWRLWAPLGYGGCRFVGWG